MFLVAVTLRGAAAADEPIRADLDFFPSRLHAFVFRNWDIVPAQRIAETIGTDERTVLKIGGSMGLKKPERISPEMQRRNVEMVIRRNWPLVPRAQIEQLLGFSAKDLDEFLGKEIFLRALLASPWPELTMLKYEEPSAEVERRVEWFRKHLKEHLAAVASTPVEPRMFFTNELCRAHDPADFVPGTQAKAGDADLRRGWTLVVSDKTTPLLESAAADFVDYCKTVQHVTVQSEVGMGTVPGARSIMVYGSDTSGAQVRWDRSGQKTNIERPTSKVQRPTERESEDRSERPKIENRKSTIENKPDRSAAIDNRTEREIEPRETWQASQIENNGYRLDVGEDAIRIYSYTDERAVARALMELERRMGERGGPFLSPCHDTMTPSFTPRYVSSYFSLMTDVLGQDLVDPFPDGYLNEIAHQDADGVWIYALLQDLVPSPVFEGMGVGSEQRLKHLREIVRRAERHGLKVYLYFNEPRAQFLPFFDKYPQVKGHVEGNIATLCTSTPMVQEHLRGSFKKLFQEVPGLGGVFLITASENWCNCYSRAHGGVTDCPRCAKRSVSDVISESIRCMAEGVWAANPKADVIVWDWSWHSLFGEAVPGEIIKKLPKGVGLMADFERGTRIVRGGVPMNVEEYSISTIGPSPRAKLRAQQAAENGMKFFAKIQLSTTWECGTVPFIPVPNLLARKAMAMRDIGVRGAMETWTIGSYPSPSTEAFAVAEWNPTLSEEQVLRYVAERRYGNEAADEVVRAWTKMSEAFAEFPFSSSPYASPLQHGPSIPWYAKKIPRPYGNASLFNPKDDWRNWTAPYPQDVMAKLLRELTIKWDEGMADFERAIPLMPRQRRAIAERDLGVAWMVNYTYRAYADALHFYGARDAGDHANMVKLAKEEIGATEDALRHVNADSRLGWEAELQYFYRPSDVLERLLSLDAIVDSLP